VAAAAVLCAVNCEDDVVKLKCVIEDSSCIFSGIRATDASRYEFVSTSDFYDTLRFVNSSIPRLPSQIPANRYLDISNVGLRYIGENGFLTFQTESTKILNVSSNALERIHPDAFTSIRLEKLVLSNNKVKSDFDFRFLANLPGLKELDMSSMGLQTIPIGAFAKLGSLLRLNLRYNQLVSFPVGSFNIRPMSPLKVIDLSHNSFTDIPIRALYALESLETLLMHSNGISLPTMPQFFPQNLTKFGLSGNWIDCDYLIELRFRHRKQLLAEEGRYMTNKMNVDGVFCCDYGIITTLKECKNL
jgi:Leucine-rich repeat (LRR) protein